MWTADFAEVATRIVQIQLAYLRAAGPAAAGLCVALALTVGVAVGRVVWKARRELDPNHRG